ncbi:MAG: TssQ family T6SS-associated lipoprotein [Rhodocyclaceae bacterium]
MISINRSARLLLALLVLSGATACVTTTPQTAPHTPAETLAAPSRWSAEDGPVVMLMGIHNYEQGEFDKAEDFLRTALTLGLPDQRDWARASKYLAFILCTSERQDDCASVFRSILERDPAFSLSRSEAGHPMWGPVFSEIKREMGRRR